MKTILSIASVLAALVPAVAMADPDPSRQPLDRSIEQVTENLAEHPGNRGLVNAQGRLLENRFRHETRTPPGQQRIERVERVDRPERPERIERLDLATRSEIVRAQRPERPNRGNGKGR